MAVSKTGKSGKTGKSNTPGPGGPLMKVESSKSNDGDRKRSEFSQTQRITYTLENRSFSLELTEQGFLGRVFHVGIDINEEIHGKGSAHFQVAFMANPSFGVSCIMTTDSSGSIKVQKAKVSIPPVIDTEILACSYPIESETDITGSCFFVEKKTNKEILERVTAAHCFCDNTDDDAMYVVTIKISINSRTGLIAEVEGPVRRAKDYLEKLIGRLQDKSERTLMKNVLMSFMFKDPVKDVRLQSDRFINSGVQSLMGLVNSSGFMKGIGNGSVYKDCLIRL